MKFLILFLYVCFNIYRTNADHNCSACIQFNVKLHFDLYSILNRKHISKEEMFNIIPDIINQTEWYYRRPHMTLPLCINVKSKSYVWSVPGLIREKDSADAILSYYCDWQILQKSEGENTYSILFTGLEIYLPDDEEPEPILGFTWQNGHCTKGKSCLVLEYTKNKDHLANTLAHELAHSIGAGHDEKRGDEIFIMYINFELNKGLPNLWSKPTRMSIIKFLQDDEISFCLGDETARKKIIDTYLKPRREDIVDCGCHCRTQ